MTIDRRKKKIFRVKAVENLKVFFSFIFLSLVFYSFFLIVTYQHKTRTLRSKEIPKLIKDKNQITDEIENKKKHINSILSSKNLEEKSKIFNLIKPQKNQQITDWLQ